MSPMVGSILVVGSSRQSGGTFPCDLCHREVNRAWTIRCALAGCERQHSICGLCLTAIQRYACADPDAADARLKAAADRAAPKKEL